MQSTIKLTTIIKRWRDILANSAQIRDFCLDKYGKPPTIFAGIDFASLPDERHCPAICLLSGFKNEGLDQSELVYGIGICWFIKQPNVTVDGETKEWDTDLTGELIEFLGFCECDDFGQLIYEVLQNELVDSFPVSLVNYEIEPQPYFPQFPGFMLLTTSIYPAIGEELNY